MADADSTKTKQTENRKEGKVYLVGAGPGDPRLITLRGVACLQLADVVLYDYLVNPVIAEHAPPTAELVCLGRHGRSKSERHTEGERRWTQQEINERLVALAAEGKTVVRLKGGDPAVFARGGEESVYLHQHNVNFEIVPGITAALAAGSHLGIPITHRDMASAVALVTGHEKDRSGNSVDYAALAKFPGTLVFYMGVTTAAHWTGELIRNGLDPKTPVAIVRRVSLPDQQVIYCGLDQVAESLTPYSKFPPPVIVIVGQVTGQQDAMNWFQQRPLFGKTVLVARPGDQAAALGNLLTEKGANVICEPAIAIEPPEDYGPLDDAIHQASEFDWIVFSSRNGVEYFFRRLFELGFDLRQIGSTKLAAVGTTTMAALTTYRLNADLCPGEFRAESLAAELAPQASGKKILLVRASRGREILATSLVDAGSIVTQVAAYSSRDVAIKDVELLEQIDEGNVDWITVTSSAMARSLADSLGERFKKSKIASISPVTTSTLKELGLAVDAEASEYTMQGVVEAILAAKCD